MVRIDKKALFLAMKKHIPIRYFLEDKGFNQMLKDLACAVAQEKGLVNENKD